MSEAKTHNIMIKYFGFFTVALFTLIGCKPKVKPIEYGHQACDYCRMSIVDERYAAQLQTSKGKTYSFDALECLINYKHENEETAYQQELVTDYNTPKKLIPAEGAYIVRSKKLPSPMGAYLTAVPTKSEAEKLVEINGGQIFTYPQVAEGLENLPEL